MTVTTAHARSPVQARLHRIEGQTRALVRMYEAGRPTTDLLDLIAAVRAALGSLGLALITHEVTDRAPSDRGTPAQDDERLAAMLMRVQLLVRCT